MKKLSNFWVVVDRQFKIIKPFLFQSKRKANDYIIVDKMKKKDHTIVNLKTAIKDILI